MKLIFRLFFPIVLAPILMKGQGLPIKYFHTSNYKVEDGLLQNHVSEIAFDGDGIMWLSFLSGLQIFDGQEFIDISDHIPINNMRYTMATANNGNMYLSDKYRIYEIDKTSLNTELIWEGPKVKNEFLWPVVILKEYDDKIVASFQRHKIYYIDKLSKSIVDSVNITQAYYNNGQNVIRPDEDLKYYYYCDSITSKLNRLNIKDKTIESLDVNIYKFEWPEIVMHDNDFVLFQDNKMIFSQNGGIHEVSLPIQGSPSVKMHAHFLGKHKLLALIDKKLFEFDLRSKKWVNELRDIQNKELPIALLQSLDTDQYGNIYTNPGFGEGLLKVSISDKFNHLGRIGLSSNFVKSIVVDEDQILFHGFDQYIHIFDTVNNLQQIIDIEDFGIKGQLLKNIFKLKRNEYFLTFSNTDLYAFLKTHDSIQITSIDNGFEGGTKFYFEGILDYSSDFLISGTSAGMVKIDKSNGQAKKIGVWKPRPIVSLEGFRDQLWIGKQSEIEILDKNNFSTISTIDLIGHGYIRDFCQRKKDFFFGSDLGLFKVVGLDSAEVIFDKVIVYSILKDNKDNLWCGTNKGLLWYCGKDTFQIFTKEDGIQENEFNTGAKAIDSSGRFYFGGVNGVTSFHPDSFLIENPTLKTIIKSIKLNDELEISYDFDKQLKEISTSYQKNNVEIQILVIGPKPPDAYNYQYKISGIHANWVNAKSDNKYTYNLSPGLYNFSYYAGDFFDPNIDDFQSFNIYIRPPFWKTWWFIGLEILLALMTILVVLYVIVQKNKTKHLEEKKELEVKLKTEEQRYSISRELHDNFGARLATVKRTSSWILENEKLSPSKIKEKIKHIELICEELNRDLREAIWVNKKVEIPVSIWVERLRHKITQTQSTLEDIQVQLKSSLPHNRILGPKEAINLTRIIQEGVQNAIKHANCSAIEITIHSDHQSLVLEISDNGKGIDVEGLDKNKEGFGLTNIRNRAEEIYFQFELKSQISQGTQIKLTSRNNE